MIDAATRKLVRMRAGDRCEYCGIGQEQEPLYRFQLEHIIARQHGGDDDPQNLAFACHHCNLHKGPNLTAIDPVSGEVVRMFHPRQDRWEAHFSLQMDLVPGLTPTGRATVRLLKMNDPARVELRRETRRI